MRFSLLVIAMRVGGRAEASTVTAMRAVCLNKKYIFQTFQEQQDSTENMNIPKTKRGTETELDTHASL